MPKIPTGIDRLPSGKYRVRVTVDGQRTTRTARTLTEARTLRSILETTTPTKTGTLNELLDRWLATKTGTVGDYTIVDYRGVADKHVRPTLGDLEAADIRPADIDRLYRTKLDGGLSASRIRRIHLVISQAFRLAVRWGDITTSPVDPIDPPAVTSHEIQPPTPQQLAAIIAACDHPGVAMFIRLAVVTGARRGELVALRGDDIDLDVGEMLISRALTRSTAVAATHGTPVEGLVGIVEKDTKTHAARRLALDDATIDDLRRHRRMLAERALSCGVGLDLGQHRWFTDDPAGRVPWRPEQVNRWWDTARRHAGYPTVRLHDLRHFAASQMLANGVDVRTAAGRLGHSNPSMTLDRYSHVIPAADRAAADILGKIVNG